MDFAARVRKAVLDSGLKQNELARRIGVTPAAVNNWLNRGARDIRSDILFALSETSGKSARWLATGEGPETPSNVSEGPQVRGMVPLISWVAAGGWDEASDPYLPGDGQTWLPCPTAHSMRTYALRVRGDSMTATHGKSYPEGCLIFVDPELTSPTNGQPVIARIDGDAEVTFKVFMRDAGRIWLRALNPAYPPITEAFVVLGTVIGKWEDA
jgi:SOS-response transcriptional repressor LexA